MSRVESLLGSNQQDVLMEIIARYHANTQDAEVVLVEGRCRRVNISSPTR